MHFKKFVQFLILTICLLMILAINSSARGPERETYTVENPADHATFNSITDNALVGDERQFVRVVEDGVGDTYSHDLTIEPGKRYRVYIYYHNDASETFNTIDKNQVGVALETRMMSSFPEELKKNERQAIVGRISSTTTSPEAVWDEAYVTAKEPLTLHYVEESVKIYNHWHQDGRMLSTELFSTEGVQIGAEDMNGVIYGGDKFSGSVGYLFETKAIEGNIKDSEVKELSEMNSTENGTDSSESSNKHNTTGISKGAVTVITVLVILVIILITVIMKLLNRLKK